MVFVFELPYHSADAGVEGADLDQHHHKTIGEKGEEDDVRRVYHSLIDRHDHLWQADRRVRKQFESSRHDQRPAGSFVEGALKAPRGDQPGERRSQHNKDRNYNKRIGHGKLSFCTLFFHLNHSFKHNNFHKAAVTRGGVKSWLAGWQGIISVLTAYSNNNYA